MSLATTSSMMQSEIAITMVEPNYTATGAFLQKNSQIVLLCCSARLTRIFPHYYADIYLSFVFLRINRRICSDSSKKGTFRAKRAWKLLLLVMVSGDLQVIHFDFFSQVAAIDTHTMHTKIKRKHQVFDFVSLVRWAYTERAALVKTKSLAFTDIDDA